MHKIDWKSIGDEAIAHVGGFALHCFSTNNPGPKCRWYAYILDRRNRNNLLGPNRRSLSEAKEDVIQLVRELLDNYKTCLDTEKRRFGI